MPKSQLGGILYIFPPGRVKCTATIQCLKYNAMASYVPLPRPPRRVGLANLTSNSTKFFFRPPATKTFSYLSWE